MVTSSNLSPFLLGLFLICCREWYSVTTNIHGEKGQPCLVLFWIVKDEEMDEIILTKAYRVVMRALIHVCSHKGIPIWARD